MEEHRRPHVHTMLQVSHPLIIYNSLSEESGYPEQRLQLEMVDGYKKKTSPVVLPQIISRSMTRTAGSQ